MSMVERPARFVLRSYDGEVLREYVLDKPQISIGRASNRDISIPQDKLISRRHIIVTYKDGNYILLDEGSANGTYLNGKLLEAMQPYVLKNDDLITLGRHQFIFQQSANVPIEDLPTVNMPLDEMLKAELEYQVQQDLNSERERALPQSLAGVTLPPPDVSTITKFQPTAPMRVISAEQLHFTAFYPRTLAAGDWGTLLVYAHLTQSMDEIQRDAANFKEGQHEVSHKQLPSDSQLLLRGTNITVVPECPGLSFSPKRFTFKWLEEWHRVEFHFSVKAEWFEPESRGRASIFAGPLLLGTLPINVTIGQTETSQYDNEMQVSVPAYKQIFSSYCRDDNAVMLACRNIYRVLGFTEMARVDALRANQIADSALHRLIDESEVFQLFWSKRAAQAAYVRKEWEYALQLRHGEGFLRPVYWDVPMEPPPLPLRSLHFTYLPSYTFIPQR
jgi:pSer/pThr/pTyr-binding forkhead associated (FHA) protein